MSTAMSYQSICSFVSHRSFTISKSSKQPLLLQTKGFKIDSSLSYYTSRINGNFSKIEAVASQTSVSYKTLLSPSESIVSENSKKRSNEAAPILIRHGESLWNAKNLFTGCVDVPLTEKGVEEAIEVGKRIRNIPIDVIFTSSLIRAQMTAMLAMIQYRCKKVPIILHNESDQAKSWSQVFSEETKDQSISVIPAWQLNERIVARSEQAAYMYGELQGLNKQHNDDSLVSVFSSLCGFR